MFPVILLEAFVCIVVKYNHKLYAPGDFRDDKMFAIVNGKFFVPGKEPKDLEKKEIIELTKQESNHIEDLVSETSRLENLCDLALKKLSAEENLFIKSQAKFGLGNRFVGFNG